MNNGHQYIFILAKSRRRNDRYKTVLLILDQNNNIVDITSPSGKSIKRHGNNLILIDGEEYNWWHESQTKIKNSRPNKAAIFKLFNPLLYLLKFQL